MDDAYFEVEGNYNRTLEELRVAKEKIKLLEKKKKKMHEEIEMLKHKVERYKGCSIIDN